MRIPNCPKDLSVVTKARPFLVSSDFRPPNITINLFERFSPETTITPILPSCLGSEIRGTYLTLVLQDHAYALIPATMFIVINIIGA